MMNLGPPDSPLPCTDNSLYLPDLQPWSDLSEKLSTIPSFQHQYEESINFNTTETSPSIEESTTTGIDATHLQNISHLLSETFSDYFSNATLSRSSHKCLSLLRLFTAPFEIPLKPLAYFSSHTEESSSTSSSLSGRQPWIANTTLILDTHPQDEEKSAFELSNPNQVISNRINYTSSPSPLFAQSLTPSLLPLPDATPATGTSLTQFPASHGHLHPGLKKEWSIIEDYKILKGYKYLGNKWARISKLVDGRTRFNVRNRCTALIRDLEETRRQEKSDFDELPHVNMNTAAISINSHTVPLTGERTGNSKTIVCNRALVRGIDNAVALNVHGRRVEAAQIKITELSDNMILYLLTRMYERQSRVKLKKRSWEKQIRQSHRDQCQD